MLQVQERIPKAQTEKSELTVKRTPEPEGKNSRDDTFQENTELFFVTQVYVHVLFWGFSYKQEFYNLWVFICFSKIHGALVPTSGVGSIQIPYFRITHAMI